MTNYGSSRLKIDFLHFQAMHESDQTGDGERLRHEHLSEPAKTLSLKMHLTRQSITGYSNHKHFFICMIVLIE